MTPLVTILLISAPIIGAALYVWRAPQFGSRATGDRRRRIEASPQFDGKRFVNPTPTAVVLPLRRFFPLLRDFFRNMRARTPRPGELEVVRVDPEAIGREDDGELRVTWLGHSTAIIEIDGQVLLTDPVFSDRAGPVSFAGPKRFMRELPLALPDVPAIDAVLLSHDHFDHLDYETIVALRERVGRFYAPLGVGAHLERWGVAPDKIVELDWWESVQHGPLELRATPSRHFSGRSVADARRTLWCSWVIAGLERRVFFGGDSGYHAGFAEIGERCGPFDVTLLECGAYSEYWSQIHSMPEETAQAHLDLRGRTLVPIHWGKFNLSLHPWTEPVERLLAAAAKEGLTVATPRIGERFAPAAPASALPRRRWWRPGDSAAVASVAAPRTVRDRPATPGREPVAAVPPVEGL